RPTDRGHTDSGAEKKSRLRIPRRQYGETEDGRMRVDIPVAVHGHGFETMPPVPWPPVGCGSVGSESAPRAVIHPIRELQPLIRVRNSRGGVAIQHAHERYLSMPDPQRSVRTEARAAGIGLVEAVGHPPESPNGMILCVRGRGCQPEE